MRIQQKLMPLLAVLLILSDCLSIKASELPENTGELPEDTPIIQENPAPENITMDDEALSQEPEYITEEETPLSPDEAELPEPTLMTTEEYDVPAPAEAPMFRAAVEYYSHGYYVVKGTFTEFLPDTSLVRPLYSLDGENWQPCGEDWNLDWMDDVEDEYAQTKLQNQICLYSNDEPLKSYLAGELDSFYLKLYIARENGESYETQAAIIERGGPQPISKEFNLIANFTPAMRVLETNPFSIYARYQITINADASPEDVSAFLPDTLPITVGLYQGIDFITEGTIDCPITWKPLSLSQLTAGESITIPDAAEEIVIPSGTLLSTPMGVFQLDEPLDVNNGLSPDMNTDEIRLVLNVVSENEDPKGALTAENDGLELSFYLKPTGATAIRAYTFSTGDTEWKELPALPLLDAVNAQASTANSGYTLVMHSDWEPYKSYLSAEAAGEDPSPFLIGLKIEGGAYDGQQLILSWPGSYELPLNLPALGGSGGNEGNAGSDNKNDSTEEGQRPELPQQPEEKTEELPPAPIQKPEDSPSAPTQKSENSPSAPTQKPEESPSAPTQKKEDKVEEQQIQSRTLENVQTEQPLNPPSNPEVKTDSLDAADTIDHEESKFNDSVQPTITTQAATDFSGENEYSTTLPTANAETDDHGPFLPAAATSAAGLCIATAIHKMAVRRSTGTP